MIWLLKQPIFWIIIIADILLVIFYKKIIGAMGELWVKKELKKLNNDYKVINNVMIKTTDGKTHQIDHIVVSEYGIFVIETKQYNGYIKGNDYDKNWMVKLGSKKYYVNNPVHQNYGHVQSIKEILNISDEKLISIVCIPSTAKINVNSKVTVGIGNLLSKIKSYSNKIIYNVEELYLKILNSNIVDRKEKIKHIKTAKNIKEKKEIENINKCPKCSGNLVQRESKYGKFIGCSNYPRCRYKK